MGNTNHLCACIEKLNQGSVIVDTNNKNNILSQINESKNAFNSKTNIPNIITTKGSQKAFPNRLLE